MPHIGSLRVDEQAVNHVGEWIRSQQACPEPAPR
jgi:hypothetical protein